MKKALEHFYGSLDTLVITNSLIKKMSIDFYTWMSKENTQEKAEEYFGYTHEEMFDRFLKERDLISEEENTYRIAKGGLIDETIKIAYQEGIDSLKIDIEDVRFERIGPDSKFVQYRAIHIPSGVSRTSMHPISNYMARVQTLKMLRVEFIKKKLGL